MDWHEVKFFESASNLKEVIKGSVGRTPSSATANEIAVCIQQGRLFFEAASVAPLPIRPLQVHYGIIGFAKAIMLARRLISLSTLKPSHGLTDATADNVKIEQLAVRVEREGTFPNFNDTIGAMGRISTFSHSMPQAAIKPFDSVTALVGATIGMKDVLSRIPHLGALYERTFEEPAKTISISLHQTIGGLWELRIDDPELYSDRNSLVALVRKWRVKHPFVDNWYFCSAQQAWGNSILIFGNYEKGHLDDTIAGAMREDHIGSPFQNQVGDRTPVDFMSILPPLSGGITRESPHAIEALGGTMLSEYSLQYMASFMLGSLVRYRPQIWQHAISRSTTAQSPADDRCLALVERFLDIVLDSWPRLLVHAIDATATRR